MEAGPYILGALAPAERRRYEQHLNGCPLCREELTELAGLRALLGRLTLDDIGGLPTDPPQPRDEG